MSAAKGRLFFWLRVGLSLGLAAALLAVVDVGELGATLAAGDPRYFLLAVGIALADRVVMAYKWGWLLKAKGIRIPLANLTGTYLITTFLGLFLPATVGADALRAYAVARRGHSGGDVVSSIVIERALGIVTLLGFGLVSIVLSIAVFGQTFFASIWGLFWTIAGALLALVGLMALSLNRRLVGAARQLAERALGGRRGQRLAEKLRAVYGSYAGYKHHRRVLLIFTLLTLVENLFPIMMNYCLALALGLEVSLLYLFILTPIVLVLVRLPISLDGIGIHQGAFVYFLALIGIPAAQGLLLSIASHLVALISVLPGGLLYAFGGLSFGVDRLAPPPPLEQPERVAASAPLAAHDT